MSTSEKVQDHGIIVVKVNEGIDTIINIFEGSHQLS